MEPNQSEKAPLKENDITTNQLIELEDGHLLGKTRLMDFDVLEVPETILCPMAPRDYGDPLLRIISRIATLINVLGIFVGVALVGMTFITKK